MDEHRSSAPSRDSERSGLGFGGMAAFAQRDPGSHPVRPLELVSAFTGRWLEMWQSSAALGWDAMERFSALWDPRQIRNWWLADLRTLTADYMRSPAFLALMRFNLKVMTQPTRAMSLFQSR